MEKLNITKIDKNFKYNDGGRKDAGFKGTTGDCAVRAISIATKKPYKEVYDEINLLSKDEKIGKRKKRKSNARTGVYTRTMRKYLKNLGWEWKPTMFIGSGCQFHLCKEELPEGILIVRLSRHFTTMINGIINDTYNPSREGTRCVYGYWCKN